MIQNSKPKKIKLPFERGLSVCVVFAPIPSRGHRKQIDQWMKQFGPEHKLEFEPSGKPRSKDSRLKISYAHSHGWIGAAFAIHEDSKNVEIGFDLECETPDRQRPVPIEKIAKRFFTPDEAIWVLKYSKYKNSRFFRVFTAKESYAKTFGSTLAKTLKTQNMLDLIESKPKRNLPLPRLLQRKILLGNKHFRWSLCISITK